MMGYEIPKKKKMKENISHKAPAPVYIALAAPASYIIGLYHTANKRRGGNHEKVDGRWPRNNIILRD